ncbi:MAG: hypothetical protein R2877_02180 [Bdellovibrionota bacterium]
MRSILFTLIFSLISTSSMAFEVVNENKSYENNRLFSFDMGLGVSRIARGEGVGNVNPGFVFTTGIGHRINQWLEAQFVYNLSTIRFSSPDPITPASNITSRAGLNQEYIQLKAYYPKVVAQPYISAGFGGYQFFGVNSETAMSFSPNMEVPLGAGFEAFIFKNSVSLNFDFTYHMLLGENQDATTLSILGLNKVSFDIYSITGGFSFHFL